MNNKNKAIEFIEKLQMLEDQYSHGQLKYHQALIYASLGDKEQTMK